ncbi:MAG: hypothetical protein K2H15_07525 [Muribaculaceae bacterium]|nr:hypothetical protein [Muribaculaceae bacterium]
MLLHPDDEDKRGNDFFDSDAQPEQPVKAPKKPSYSPDDPAYWEEEESEWEHLKPRSSVTPWLWCGGVVVLIGLIVACWLRYFSPYIDDATQFGYVENIERRGSVFKTYEGVLIPYKELMDTTRIYRRDFIFTAENESIAIKLKKAQFDARPVRVGYRRYHATVPWRGSSNIVITSVDSADPARILPPEFAPSLRKD